jgi:hypothetical protein
MVSHIADFGSLSAAGAQMTDESVPGGTCPCLRKELHTARRILLENVRKYCYSLHSLGILM